MRRRLVIRIQACPFYTTIVDTASDLTPKDQTNILTIRNTRNIRNFNTRLLFVTGQTGAPNEILSMGPQCVETPLLQVIIFGNFVTF